MFWLFMPARPEIDFVRIRELRLHSLYVVACCLSCPITDWNKLLPELFVVDMTKAEKPRNRRKVIDPNAQLFLNLVPHFVLPEKHAPFLLTSPIQGYYEFHIAVWAKSCEHGVTSQLHVKLIHGIRIYENANNNPARLCMTGFGRLQKLIARLRANVHRICRDGTLN